MTARYGPEWPTRRQEALERDDYTCQECGGEGNTVHHKEYAPEGETAPLDALVTLCSKCHGTRHGKTAIGRGSENRAFERVNRPDVEELPTAVPSRNQRINYAIDDAESLTEYVLTGNQSLAYALRCMYGIDRQEAADIMGVSHSNLDNAYRRAKDNVQSAIDIVDMFGLADEDRVLSTDLGGKVGRLVSKFDGSRYVCQGCGGIHMISSESWHGHLHKDGLLDGRGRRWWAYIPCSQAEYDNSWMDVRHNRVEPNIITQGQVVITNDPEVEVLSLTISDESGETIARDELDYSYFAEGIEVIRTPPHTIEYYDFRGDYGPRPSIGGDYDSSDLDEPPTFTLRVEDDNDSNPFEQTYTPKELGIRRT